MNGLVRLSLEAVVAAVTDDRPRVLTVGDGDGALLPAGLLETEEDVTLERGMRRLIDEQTGLDVGYVEQLYTFGDLQRERRRPSGTPRLVGVAYLVLTREARTPARWVDWYELLPWEDHREGPPEVLLLMSDALVEWAGGDDDRRERVQIAFGIGETPWDPIRVLDRYELLYEARMLPEWYVDREEAVAGRVLAGRRLGRDHRRVVATALGRLRGKLTYRPVVFEMLPEVFTLSQLQHTVEALAGHRLHTQNFRRLVERGGLVEGTGRSATTGGRPAALFRFRREVLTERPQSGLAR